MNTTKTTAGELAKRGLARLPTTYHKAGPARFIRRWDGRIIVEWMGSAVVLSPNAVVNVMAD